MAVALSNWAMSASFSSTTCARPGVVRTPQWKVLPTPQPLQLQLQSTFLPVGGVHVGCGLEVWFPGPSKMASSSTACICEERERERITQSSFGSMIHVR